MYTKSVPQTVHYTSFTIRSIRNHLHRFTICIIYLEWSIKVFSTIWTSHWTTGSSVKPSISGVKLSENAPWVLVSLLWQSFPYLSVITIFEITSCIFILKWISCCNSLVVPLPFLLCHYVNNQMGESWRDEQQPNINHHNIIISDNIAIQLSSFCTLLSNIARLQQ